MIARRAAAVLLAAAALMASVRPAGAVDKRLKWDKKWGPLVPHTKFPRNCSICHVPKRWDVIRKDFHFDHAKETGYPLLGAHQDAACLRCHNDRGPLKAYLARGCGGCHVDPHKGTLGLNCTTCHDQTAWVHPGRMGQKIADHARTRFPLTGMHASIQCQQCHIRADSGEFAGAPVDCISCHQKDYQAAPNHVAQNYPQTCQNCHTTAAFAGGTFNHASFGASLTCVNCHQSDFQSAPNHVSQNFSQACQNCHNTSTWAGANFNHQQLGPNPVCITCHQTDYNGAKSTPASNHTANGFPTTCQNCHVTTSWGPGTAMQHNYVSSIACYNCHSGDFATAKATPASNHAANGFPTTCQNCHNTTAFGPGTAMQHSFVSGAACYTCHQTDFQSAPNHVSQNFAKTCQTCHSGTTTWLGAVFDHSSLGANPVCYNCHSTEYAGAKTTPASNHAANGFPTTCQNCHTYAAWGPGTAMQHSYVSSIACYTCHSGDYASAKTTPASNHAANAFPTTCQNCHTTTAFGPGTAMQHSFVGGAGAVCQTCHMTDFNGASSPVNHAVQGIPASSCNTCHTTFTTWSSFTHSPSNCYNTTSFTSHHNATCAQCHPGGSYGTATCTACHSNRGNSCD